MEQPVAQKPINQAVQGAQTAPAAVSNKDKLLLEEIKSGQKTFCPKCNNLIESFFLFCPTCGYKLKEPPVTLGKQIGIYLLSFLLPPLGLWPAFKLLRQNDSKSKKVAVVAIVLTLISTIMTIMSIVYTLQFANTYTQQLNSNMNLYNGLLK